MAPRECAQELCPNWAGDGGCPCLVLGLEQPTLCTFCGEVLDHHDVAATAGHSTVACWSCYDIADPVDA